MITITVVLMPITITEAAGTLLTIVTGAGIIIIIPTTEAILLFHTPKHIHRRQVARSPLTLQAMVMAEAVITTAPTSITRWEVQVLIHPLPGITIATATQI